jgi:hypothetical protein
MDSVFEVGPSPDPSFRNLRAEKSLSLGVLHMYGGKPVYGWQQEHSVRFRPGSLTRRRAAYTFTHLPHLSRVSFACPGRGVSEEGGKGASRVEEKAQRKDVDRKVRKKV